MSSDRYQRLALPGYVLAALMFVFPVVDIWVISVPTDWGDVQWRFGFLGTMTRVAETLVLALLLTFMLAAMLRHRRRLRVMSVVALVAFVVMLGISALFAFDALEVRPMLNPQFAGPFDRVMAVGMLKIIAWTVILAAFSWAGFSSSRRLARQRRIRPDESSVTVLPDS